MTSTRTSILSACIIVIAAATVSAQEAGPEPAPSIEFNSPETGEKFPWPQSAVNSFSATQGVKGTLAIQAVQGTPGGPAIGAVEAEVELVHRGMTLNTIKIKLDEHGVAMIEDLPVSMGVQPIVRVFYDDLTYQVAGGWMDATHPQQKLEVICYESTENPPAWRVLMRHVMISPAPEGVQVTEVLVIENPDDVTWTGVKGSPAKKITTSFKLPEGATNVSLGRGFHEWCCSTLTNGVLMNHLPLMPQTTEMIFGYTLPARKGAAVLDITAPAAVQHTMILAPQSIKVDSTSGLTDNGLQSMGETSVRAYMASGLSAGEKVTITLAGLRSPASPTTASAAQSIARIIAIIGGGLILVAALAVIVYHSKKSPEIVRAA